VSLTHGSLFSGIGGIGLGFERVGIETTWQVEIDEYARRVLEKHWPGVERFSDIRECGAHNLKPVDIISGGFPCQDLSVAGKQQGLDAGRSGLWWEMLRVACELRPRILVVENVPNLLAGDGGDWARTFFGSLAESGFDAEWGIVSAAQAGAPHLRKRVFVVAYARCAERGPHAEGWNDPDGSNAGREEAAGRPIVSSADGRARDVAYAAQQPQREQADEADAEPACGQARQEPGGGSESLPDALGAGLEGGWEGLFAKSCWEWWSVEPDVGRMVDGFSPTLHGG